MRLYVNNEEVDVVRDNLPAYTYSIEDDEDISVVRGARSLRASAVARAAVTMFMPSTGAPMDSSRARYCERCHRELFVQ